MYTYCSSGLMSHYVSMYIVYFLLDSTAGTLYDRSTDVDQMPELYTPVRFLRIVCWREERGLPGAVGSSCMSELVSSVVPIY